MMKNILLSGLVALSLVFAGGTLAQTMNSGTDSSRTPSTTMSPSPSVTPSGLQSGQGGSGSMPSGAPNTGLGGSQ